MARYERWKRCRCGRTFLAQTSVRRFCSKKCRKFYHRPTPVKLPAKIEDPHLGHYVYGWYDNKGCFYIGRGKDNRAWISHGEQLCQKHRETAIDFQVVIFRAGLTQEGAMLVESVLIDLLKPKCNIQKGTSRPMYGPLTRGR